MKKITVFIVALGGGLLALYLFFGAGIDSTNLILPYVVALAAIAITVLLVISMEKYWKE